MLLPVEANAVYSPDTKGSSFRVITTSFRSICFGMPLVPVALAPLVVLEGMLLMVLL